MLDISSHDIVLVGGGGGAGLRAAIAISQSDPKLSVGGRFKGVPDAQSHRGGRGRSGRSLSSDSYGLPLISLMLRLMRSIQRRVYNRFLPETSPLTSPAVC